MSRKFLTNIDLSKNELQNARIQNLASAPSSPVTGQVYYNTVDNSLYIYNGARWEIAGNAIATGLLSARPGASTVDAGTFYYATDNNLFYYSDGATWTQTNAFGTVTAGTSYGQSSSNGTSTNYARADHTHGTPPLTSTAPTNLTATTAAVGTGTAPSREDHVHGFTPGNFAISSFGQATANVNLNSNRIINLADPTSAQDAATKAYVDGTAQGLDVKASVRAATTTAGTLATSFANGSVIDGVTLVTGDRILIKNQATASENGIYTVNASGAPTRAIDANVSSEVTAGMFTFVSEGTLLGNTGWVLTTDDTITLGTTALTFTQFSGAGTYTASNGVLLTGTNFTFNPTGTGGLQTAAGGASILLATNSGLGTSASGLAVGAGTGIVVSTNTVAIDTAVVVRKYAQTLSTSATSYVVTHNLNTQDVVVAVYDLLDSSVFAEAYVDVEHTSVNTITLRFSVAPTANKYRVVVQG